MPFKFRPGLHNITISVTEGWLPLALHLCWWYQHLLRLSYPPLSKCHPLFKELNHRDPQSDELPVVEVEHWQDRNHDNWWESEPKATFLLAHRFWSTPKILRVKLDASLEMDSQVSAVVSSWTLNYCRLCAPPLFPKVCKRQCVGHSCDMSGLLQLPLPRDKDFSSY